MSAGPIASEMAKQLSKYGLIEYKDFCKFDEWLFENEWRQNKKLYLSEVVTSITSRCTLNCKHCYMLMPYFKKAVDYTISDFQNDIDLLFNYTDYLGQLGIIGGEPLLNHDLEKMLEWICLKYKDKIGKVVVSSNGTVLPSKELLKICSQNKNKITIGVTDYTDEVPYKARLNEVITLLKEAKVEYMTIESKDLKWRDLGFPVYNFPIQKGKEQEHMLGCGPCHGLNDGKLYYCLTVWAASKSDLFKESKGDYVDLRSLSTETGRINILHQYRGEIYNEGKFLNLCAICGGFGSDNDRIVKAGVQIKDRKQ